MGLQHLGELQRNYLAQRSWGALVGTKDATGTFGPVQFTHEAGWKRVQLLTLDNDN